MPSTQVYVNWGRIVANCSAPGCNDAREVEPGQPGMQCCVGEGCPGHLSDLVWPDNMPQILAALAERVSDKRKNWFPAGHPLALAGGIPAGETPDELRAETAAGEAQDAQRVADKRAALITQLLQLGSGDDIINEIREQV